MESLHKTVDDGIAKIVLDLPGEPVNKISRLFRDELEALVADLRSDPGVRAAVLISGKPDTFLAGADIDEFAALRSQDEALALIRQGQSLVSSVGELGKPVVAAIHGAALGGGLEATLTCDYRVATDHPKTQLGLPEVQLGVIPAAGGCQRLPRLIGLRAALDIILAGKVVPAKRALRLGIVDELVHPAILERVALETARRLAEGWKPSRGGSDLVGWALEGNPLGRRVIYSEAEKQVRKTSGGHYPAPLAALDAVQRGLEHGISAGLAREAEHFAELAVGEVSRNLVQIFFGTTELKKDPGVEGAAPEPRRVARLGVVGAGFMGSGIGGTAVLQAGAQVRFRDADNARVGAGLRAADKILKARLKRKRITEREYDRLRALASGGVDWAGFRRADLVIEAVFEDLEVKRSVFRDLEAQVGDECVLASNTSTIPIARIAEPLRAPERVLGMHFFSPVEKMPLLEVIVTDKTAPWATVTALAFGRKMGKTTIVVRDRPGFWVNRILSPYLNEAGALLYEGARIEDIDSAMTSFGFPVGPITLLDEVGLDVANKGSSVMFEAFGERMKPSDGIAELVKQGRLGRKSGSGFYTYEDGKKKGADSAIYEILGVEQQTISPTQIRDRLVYALLNEAALAFDEGVVRSARDGDLGAIFGIGYPPFRGGPLRTLDQSGHGAALEVLKRLRAEHGERFAPAPILARMAQSDERFYGK